MAEVMPMQIRGKGNAFAVGIGNWAVSTLWNQVSPVALGKLQWRFYFVFVAWSELPPSVNFMAGFADPSDLCISLPVIYFFFQETKQKSLEEIDLLFGGRPSVLRENDVVEHDTNLDTQQFDKAEMDVSATNVENADSSC
jgi:hypothetical protein